MVGIAVEPGVFRQVSAVVGKEFEVVPDDGRTPNLGGIGHIGIAGGNERFGVVALRRAIGIVGVAVFQAEVGPRIFSSQADVAGEAVGEAVPCLVDTGPDFNRAAPVAVLELETHHPGNGVRTVLRRGAVAQDFHLFQGNRRNDR